MVVGGQWGRAEVEGGGESRAAALHVCMLTHSDCAKHSGIEEEEGRKSPAPQLRGFLTGKQSWDHVPLAAGPEEAVRSCFPVWEEFLLAGEEGGAEGGGGGPLRGVAVCRRCWSRGGRSSEAGGRSDAS